MTNETDDLDVVRRKIRQEGARKAVDALISVCDNPKAPAPAKATAGTSLLRAAGLFDRVEEADKKELHELSAAELGDRIRHLRKRLAERTPPAADIFD